MHLVEHLAIVHGQQDMFFIGVHGKFFLAEDAQKNLKKKKTSETINNNIPHRKPSMRDSIGQLCSSKRLEYTLFKIDKASTNLKPSPHRTRQCLHRPAAREAAAAVATTASAPTATVNRYQETPVGRTAQGTGQPQRKGNLLNTM
jgi:hypothetical protein